jgi:hypothetical protein
MRPISPGSCVAAAADRARSAWNFCEVGPQQLLGRFNGFLKSVILRINEHAALVTPKATRP